VAEVWGNPSGGVSSGTVYTGLMSFQGNVGKAAWMARSWLFHTLVLA